MCGAFTLLSQIHLNVRVFLFLQIQKAPPT